MAIKIIPEEFKPLHDWVLVRKEFTDNKTASGLIVTVKEERPLTGHILAIGDKVQHLKVGERVIFHKHAGTTFDADGEKLSIIREVDIFGIFDV